MADDARRLYGVQFHPEVVHTQHGRQILTNFLFDICQCKTDWDPRHRVPLVEQRIKEVVGDRNVFFFVSGGVDSTVAFTLCLRALGADRVSGFYVDTGLMREGETAYVRNLFKTLGTENFMVEEAGDQFLGALQGVVIPRRSATSSESSSSRSRSASSRRDTSSKATGSWGRAPSTRTRSSPAEQPKRTSSRPTTTGSRGFRN